MATDHLDDSLVAVENMNDSSKLKSYDNVDLMTLLMDNSSFILVDCECYSN